MEFKSAVKEHRRQLMPHFSYRMQNRFHIEQSIDTPLEIHGHPHMSFEDRLKYYLGDFYNKTSITVYVDDKYKTFKQNGIYYYLGPDGYPDDFKFDHGYVRPGWWWHQGDFQVTFPCLTNSADGYESDELPVLTKARIIGNYNNGILIKYEYNYHWHILHNFNDSYTWENKDNRIVWRGNSWTGHNKKYNRFTFVEKYYQHHNVGFSDTNPAYPIDCNKGPMSVEEQLKYKYLICIEGNDVATSLKWQLLSNSVVLMSKPMIEGWLMEGLLQPYVHYIPLKEDFSDLEEILDWCSSHDDICRQIAQNSTRWMEQFLDYDNELKLHDAIIQWYKTNVVFENI